MGDRSYMNLWIYEIPDGQAQAIFEVLEDYGVGCDTTHWDEAAQRYVVKPMTLLDMLDAVVNAADFYNEECSLGTADEVSGELTKLGVAHQAHQDPKFEFPGSLSRFHPKLGSWYSGHADAEANAYLTDWEYRQLEKTAMQSEEPFEVALLELIGEKLGIAYEDDFRQLTGQLDLNKWVGGVQ